MAHAGIRQWGDAHCVWDRGKQSPYGSGFGMFVRGADGATPRVAIGSSLDGTTYPSFVNLYDSSGKSARGYK